MGINWGLWIQQMKDQKHPFAKSLTFDKACKSRSNRHWVFVWYSEIVVHMRVMIYLHQPLLGSSLTGREDTETGWVPRVCYITHGCGVWLKYPFSMSQVACILWYTGWTENTHHSVTTSEKNPSVVEGWGIFSNKAFYSWCVRALGQGGLLWKIPGSRDFVCNLYFPNRVSLVVTLGKAPLSGDYADRGGPWPPSSGLTAWCPDRGALP